MNKPASMRTMKHTGKNRYRDVITLETNIQGGILTPTRTNDDPDDSEWL